MIADQGVGMSGSSHASVTSHSPSNVMLSNIRLRRSLPSGSADMSMAIRSNRLLVESLLPLNQEGLKEEITRDWTSRLNGLA